MFQFLDVTNHYGVLRRLLDVFNSQDLWHLKDKRTQYICINKQQLQAKNHTWKLNADLAQSIGIALLKMAS